MEFEVRVMCVDIPLFKSLIINGSRAWVHFVNSQIEGWDFEVPGSAPISLSNIPLDRPHPYFIGTMWHSTGPSRIESTITRKQIFQLPGRYAKPEVAQWDGQYLAAGYESGEVLILDFSHMNLK